VLANVIDSSNLVPATELSASVEDVDAVLEDGSGAQAAFVQGLKEKMALALGIEAVSIEISGLRPAADATDQGAGRRTQTAGEVTFDVEITGPDAFVALTRLSEQVLSADPDSALRTGAGITSEALAFSFRCPVGMFRPLGGSECSYCSDTSIPDAATSFQSCKECIPGQAPDRTSHSQCVCANGYYNSSSGANPIKCYTEGEQWSPIEAVAADSTDCVLCADTGCTDDSISCVDGNVLLQPGFSVSMTSIAQEVPVDAMTGQRSIYACSIPGACLGDPVVPPETGQGVQQPTTVSCSPSYDGPLCDYCAEDYSRPGFTGECTECTEGLSTVIAVLGGVVAVVLLTVAM
jgi:hypothetical protein